MDCMARFFVSLIKYIDDGYEASKQINSRTERNAKAEAYVLFKSKCCCERFYDPLYEEMTALFSIDKEILRDKNIPVL